MNGIGMTHINIHCNRKTENNQNLQRENRQTIHTIHWHSQWSATLQITLQLQTNTQPQKHNKARRNKSQGIPESRKTSNWRPQVEWIQNVRANVSLEARK